MYPRPPINNHPQIHAPFAPDSRERLVKRRDRFAERGVDSVDVDRRRSPSTAATAVPSVDGKVFQRRRVRICRRGWSAWKSRERLLSSSSAEEWKFSLFVRPCRSLARVKHRRAIPSTLAHNKAGRGNVPWHSRVSCFNALFAPWKRAAPTPIEFPDSIKYFSLARLASPSCQGTTNANDSLVKWRPTPPTLVSLATSAIERQKRPAVSPVSDTFQNRPHHGTIHQDFRAATIPPLFPPPPPFLPLFKLTVCYWVFLLFLRSLVFLITVSFLFFVKRFCVLSVDLSVPPCSFAWALLVHLPPVFLLYRFWSILLFSVFTVALYRSRLISFRSTSLPLFSRKLPFLLLSFERLFSVFCKLQGGQGRHS